MTGQPWSATVGSGARRVREDLDLVIGGAEVTVQLGELAGVLGVAAFGRGGELGAQPADGLGMLGRGLVSGVGGVAAAPVELGLVLGAAPRPARRRGRRAP
jgi:hypothetical protein